MENLQAEELRDLVRDTIKVLTKIQALIMVAISKSNEIKIIRIYDAPAKTVWDAYTEPEQVAHWWGPRGFTLTTHSKDLKVGGTWDYTMHGPDGVDFPNLTKYLEVEKYQRLVYDHGANADRPPMFRVTVVFSEFDGKTKMDMTMALPTIEAAEATRKFIKKASGDSTWDRFAEYLDKKTMGKESFVINRSFEAPLATVFEMWTNPKHFAKWLPPTGAEMSIISGDIKPGGGILYCMTTSTGAKMYGRVNYKELSHPNHLLYTQQFCDEKGNISRNPMTPYWPETMLTNVTFAEEGPAQTRVTVSWEPHGKCSAEELDTFIKARTGMTGGWTGSFDKLEEYLASRAT